VESADNKISILLHVISCANSRAPERRRSLVDSRASLRARASRKANEEVLNDVPISMTEDALRATEAFDLEAFFGLRVCQSVLSKLLLSGIDIVAG